MLEGADQSQQMMQQANLMAQRKLYMQDKKSNASRSIFNESLKKSDLMVMKQISTKHLEEQPGVSGVDPKFFNDEDNFMPNTDYSVTLDFKKEFIRHKRIICSLKTLSEFDI